MSDEAMQHDPSLEAESSPPLAGRRVLDLSDRVGAYCSKVLADLGADVVKVELPTGDELRGMPPFHGVEGGESSLMFAYYHHNKRGITVDWTRADSEPILRELASRADVVLASPNRRSAVVGLDADGPSLSWVRSGCVTAFVTPFGMTGPLRDWRSTPFTSFAISGYMHPAGPEDGPPVAMPGQQLFDQSGVCLALTIQAVLLRPEDARPPVLDHSVHEVGFYNKIALEKYGLIGRIATRATNFGPPPGGIWRCSDGLVDIGCHSSRHWDIFVEVLDRPPTLVDELYRDRSMRAQLFDLLNPLIADEMAKQSAKLFVRHGQELGLPCAVRQSLEEFLVDEQPTARRFFVTSQREGTGSVTIPGHAYKSEPNMLDYRRSAPTLGQHNAEVFEAELGHTCSEVTEWSTRGLI